MKCFVRLAATKKLTETANMEGIRASTVSKYLDGMEDEIKAELFHRSAGGIELTKDCLLYTSCSMLICVLGIVLIAVPSISARVICWLIGILLIVFGACKICLLYTSRCV